MLPINITFNPATNIDYSNAGGATLQSYDPLTRTIIFKIPNTSVEVNDGIYTIRLNIQVVPDCNSLTTACSNVIKNQAFATYQGVINPNIFQEEGSFASTACKLGSPDSTNFLVDISNCKFTQNVILCGSSVVLKASDGYSNYSWSRNSNGSNPIGTGQTFTATQTGVYYVHNTAPPTCKDIVEEITVKNFGLTNTNPVIPYAQSPYVGEVVICPDDGKQLPNLFLCGANDSRLIQTGISDATSIEWYKLNEGSCVAVVNPDCANENPSCSWLLVGNGPDFTANISGQFRLTIRYPGGCFSQFYFNVYQNLLNPTATSKDILCNTNGQITVGGVPSGYEYSLNPSGPYQPSNVFPNASFPTINAGSYTVYIKQVGVTASPCIFSVPNILIRQRNFTVSTILTQPLCNGDKGSIKLIANDALPQYYFSISQGATLVNSVGPIAANEYQFSNLNPGIYTVRVWTDDGCDYSNNITIIEPTLLTATAAITKPLTCTDGEITVYPVGGTPPYIYYVNNATVFQNSPQITITNPLPVGGIYNILIEDSNNCTTTATITVAAIPPPVYTMNQVNIKCYSEARGVISFNVTNANGYSIAYSIDNGVTYLPTPTFTNLAAGTYNTIVRYTLGTDVCYGTMQPITITQPAAAVTASAGVSELAGCGPLGEGKIRITNPQGGTAPYEYSFDNQVTWTTLNEAYKAPGTYTVYIRDANGCIFTMPNIIINQPPIAPTINVSTPVFNCDGSSRSAVTVITTPNMDYSYQYFLDGVVNTNMPSNVFVNIPAGTHIISVKYISTSTAISCIPQSDLQFIVPTGNAFNASITGFKNVSCFGANDATITIAAQNFDTTNGFQFSMNNGATWITQLTSPHTITGLSSGTYAIQIRYDATSTGTCLKTFSQTIVAPTPVTVAASVTTLATCSSGATISAIGSEGTLAYQYELRDAAGVAVIRPYQLNAQFTNVSVGSYTVFVKDANGCISNIGAPINVVAPPTLAATLSSSSDLCFDSLNQASLIVNVTGGKAPFTYSLNGAAPQNTNTFNNVSVGTHNIIVTDSNNCTSTINNIVIAPQLIAEAIITKSLDCTASPDAVITGAISGGTAPFVVSIISGTGTITQPVGLGTAFSFTTSSAGAVQFKVTDANGCAVNSAVITVSPIVNPVINLLTQVQQIYCFGDATGAIRVDIDSTKGVGPYTINVLNTTTNTSYGTQTSGLPAGNYEVTVTDSKGCVTITPSTINILQPADIVVNFTVFPISCDPLGGVSKGKIVINSVTGGSPLYTYIVTGTNGYMQTETNNGGSASVTFDIVDFGLYQINIVDQNGCSKVIKDQLVASPPNSLMISVTSPPSNCITGGSATVAVGSAFAGIGPFYFSLYTGTVLPYPSGTWLSEDTPGSKQAVFTNLTPGVTYTYVVYDSLTKCYYFETGAVPIPTNSTLLVNNIIPNNVSCKGSANGTVSFTINSTYPTATPIDYEIFDSLTLVTTGETGSGIVPVSGTLTLTSGSLSPGNYFALIKETGTATNSGCSQTSSKFTISESAVVLTVNATILKNENCNQLGKVSVIAQGGTAGYAYQVLPSTSAAPLSTDSGWVVTNTFSLAANTYIAYAKDTNGCIQPTTPFILNKDPEPVVSAVISNQCNTTEGTFAINVSVTNAGVAPYSFSIDGGAFQTQPASFTISNLSSGTHTVEIKDVNGCGNFVSVSILAPLGLTSTITALPSCIDGDGMLTLLATGGSGNYEYSIDSGIYQVSANFATIFAGTHTLTVRDITSTCTQSIPVTFGAATLITGFALTKTDVTCNGGNDGTITASLATPAVGVNDNPIYTYSIDGGVTTQTSPVFSGLIAGFYTVEVTSGRGCVDTQTIVVDEPNVISFPMPTVVQFGCNSGSNAMNFATITVTAVTGGSGVYANYEFIKGGTRVQFGATNTYTEANLLGGTYTVNVYDNKGCIGTTTAAITIVPYIALDKIDVAINNVITCTNLEDITVSARSIGGIPTNLQYSLVDVSGAIVFTPNTTGVFTGLNIGNYIITVENLDTGCSIQTVHYVNNPNTFDLNINNIVDVTCFGGANGSANVTIVDGIITAANPDQAGPFNYTIVDSLGNSVSTGTSTTAGPFTINALAAGTYAITATLINSPFCSVTKNFTVNQPTAALTLSETHTNITCVSGNNDGSISATAIGGWPGGYEFQLERGATVVTSWSSVANFTGLTQGTYTVRVRDANGCSVFVNVILTNPTSIVFTATPSTTILSCFGDKNASISVSMPTGGQGSNYLYTLNTTSLVPATISGPQVLPIFNDLGAGTYTVTVTDGYSCTATSAPIVIASPIIVSASLVVASTQTCNNQATLALSAFGGTPPYSYSADGVTYNAITFNSSVTFPVAIGTHHYFVKDANGCASYVSNDIQIDPLPVLVIKLDLSNAVVNCAGDATGVIVATAEGGLSNYVYTLQDAAGNPLPAAVQSSPGVFTQLVAGGYRVQVSSLDCSATSALITVTEPSTPLVSSYVATDATCNGNNNGTITINASGGTGIIKYAISPRLDQFFVSNVFKLLQPGSYDIIAQDQKGCFIYTTAIVIAEPTIIIPQVDQASIIPEICFGDKDGFFSIDIIGGTAPYSVSLDKINGPFTVGIASQTQFDFTGLEGGDHTVYIRDANLCNTELTVSLPASVLLIPNLTVEYGCLNNAPSSKVTVSIDSSVTNSADVDYALDGSGVYQASNVFTNLSPGMHFITARHTNGCEKNTVDFEILQIQPLTLELKNGGLNEIIATTTGGSPQYRYTFNGEDYGSKNTYIYYKSGEYTVTVTDSNGCFASAIKYFEFIDIDIPNVFTPNGDGNNDGWMPTNTMNYPDLIFHVFDRYGRKVGTFKEGQSWDGKYNDKELPTGDYWYVLKLQNEEDSREFVGHFTLYR